MDWFAFSVLVQFRENALNHIIRFIFEQFLQNKISTICTRAKIKSQLDLYYRQEGNPVIAAGTTYVKHQRHGKNQAE